MKEGERHAPGRGGRVEIALRGLQPAAGGQVAAVLGAVGVSHHHNLAISAAAEMLAIGGLVEDRGESLVRLREVIDLLEQRHDGDVGFSDDLAGRPRTTLRPPPQPEHGEHVGGAAGQAHDRAADTLRAEADAGRVKHTEQPQRIEGERPQLILRHVADEAQRVDEYPAAGLIIECIVSIGVGQQPRGGENVTHDLAVGPGVLPDVEPRHVEAERADEIEPGLRRGFAGGGMIAGEALEQGRDIGFEVVAGSVCPVRSRRGERLNPRRFEAEPHHPDPAPVDLVRHDRFERGGQFGPAGREVFEPPGQRLRAAGGVD